VRWGPRLEAIAGPLEGATFALSGEVSIGRDPCSTIPIADTTLAPRHCALRKKGKQFQIEVSEDYSNVLVNGLPASSRVLQNGDEIKIGNSVFIVLLSDPSTEVPTTLSEFDLFKSSMQIIEREEILALKEPEALETLSSCITLAHDWSSLLRVCRTVNSIQNLEELEQHLLALVPLRDESSSAALRAASLLLSRPAGSTPRSSDLVDPVTATDHVVAGLPTVPAAATPVAVDRGLATTSFYSVALRSMLWLVTDS